MIRTLNVGEKVVVDGKQVTVTGLHKHSMMLSKKYTTTGGPIFWNGLTQAWEQYQPNQH